MAAGKHSAPKHSKKKNSYAQNQYGYQPAQKKRGSSRKAPIIIILIVVLVAAALGGYFFLNQDHKGSVKQGQEISVEIKSGSSTSAIADTLVDNGVIASANEFTKAVEKRGDGSKMQAGNYTFTGGEDIDEIIDRIVKGEVKTLTIPEGYTLKQISQTVADKAGLNKDEFYSVVSTGAATYAKDYPFLASCYGGSMEGFLFPATYAIDADITVDSLIRDMLDQYKKQFATVDMSYATSKNLTEYDVVTLASMIEKESRSDADKADISAVFYNRLHAGINLGSDVTTYYAVGKDMTEELTTSDLASDSPYNTRNVNLKGLPAGPICNPSLASLKAAANPSAADYLYFFYSSKNSQVQFYKTQQEFDAAWAQENK